MSLSFGQSGSTKDGYLFSQLDFVMRAFPVVHLRGRLEMIECTKMKILAAITKLHRRVKGSCKKTRGFKRETCSIGM